MPRITKNLGVVSPRKSATVPQSAPASPRNVQNNAGGYVFAVSPATRFKRWLILQSDTTYYQDAKTLTRENAKSALALLKSNPQEYLAILQDVSIRGLAPRQDVCIFALALALSPKEPETTRQMAEAAFPNVVRTAEHLFQIIAYRKLMGEGFGRRFCRVIGKWYTDKSVSDVSYQLVKYRQRHEFTHYDALMLAHPKSSIGPEGMGRVFDWVTAKHATDKGWMSEDDYAQVFAGLPLEATSIVGYERASHTATPAEDLPLIEKYGLTWEALQTEHLRDPQVWEALLPKMPLMAMLRNLGRMTNIGLLKQGSAASRTVIEKLTDPAYWGRDWAMSRSKPPHPFNILVALLTYKSGHGSRGNLAWQPVGQVIDALDAAFYASFKTIKPSGKKIMIALDVSGSMGGPDLMDVPGLSPRVAAAAFAMMVARTESNYLIGGFETKFTEYDITPRMRLDTVCKTIADKNFGGTDCALPMLYAMGQNNAVDNRYGYYSSRSGVYSKTHAPTLDFDGFVVFSDSETWAGGVHANVALEQYRDAAKRDARLVVCAMTASGFTIADPKDPGMLDVCGLSSDVPAIISGFLAGEF